MHRMPSLNGLWISQNVPSVRFPRAPSSLYRRIECQQTIGTETKRAQRAHNLQRILQAARDFNLILNGIKMIWLNNLSFVHFTFSYCWCRAVRSAFFRRFFPSFLFLSSCLFFLSFSRTLFVFHINKCARERVWVIKVEARLFFYKSIKHLKFCVYSIRWL